MRLLTEREETPSNSSLVNYSYKVCYKNRKCLGGNVYRLSWNTIKAQITMCDLQLVDHEEKRLAFDETSLYRICKPVSNAIAYYAFLV